MASAGIEFRLQDKSELNDLGQELSVLKGGRPLSVGLVGGLNEIRYGETFSTVLILRRLPMAKCHFSFSGRV